MFKRFVSRRYLRTKRITWFAILGVALGVMTLVVVMSVMRGFANYATDTMGAIRGEVVVEYNDLQGFENADAFAETVRNLDGVEEAAPRFECYGIAGFNTLMSGSLTIRFIGIDPERESRVNAYRDIVGGTLDEMRSRFADLDWDPNREDAPPLILGQEFFREADTARRWCELGGEEVKLTTFEMFEFEPAAQYFHARNVFRSGIYDYDSNTVYIALDRAQNLVKRPGCATHLMLRATEDANPADVRRAVADLISRTRPDADLFSAKLLAETEPDMQNAIWLERVIMAILLYLILAIAAFCTVAIMSMMVIEKAKDIAILRSAGASRRAVGRVFLRYGLLVGLVGAAIGVVGGLAFLHWLDPIEKLVGVVLHVKPFDRDFFNFKNIPRETTAAGVLLICLIAVATSVAAAVYPARRAARLEVVEALRYE